MESKENDKSCDEEMGSAGGAGNPEEGKETGPAQEGNPVSQSAGDGNPDLQTGPVPGQTPFPYGYFQSPNLHPGYYMAQGGGFPGANARLLDAARLRSFPTLQVHAARTGRTARSRADGRIVRSRQSRQPATTGPTRRRKPARKSRRPGSTGTRCPGNSGRLRQCRLWPG